MLDRWISLKDKTPDIAGCECLVSATNEYGQRAVFIAFCGYGYFRWYTMDVTKTAGDRNNAVSSAWTITHWMPLPEPPKTANE